MLEEISIRKRRERSSHRRGRIRRTTIGVLALTCGLWVLPACLSSKSVSGTPTVVSTRTAIPALTIVTPTPPGSVKPGSVATTTPVTPTPATSHNGQNGTYTVQAGDTLYNIAVKFNVTIQALMKANSITDPTSLQAGQVLVIP